MSNRVLLVEDNKGEFKIELPEKAKLTFGPNVPYAKKNGYIEKESGYALRIYLGTKENIIAVFCNVKWFRDVSLVVHRKIMQEAGKTVWKSDEKGYKVENEVKVDSRWEQELIGAKALPAAAEPEEF